MTIANTPKSRDVSICAATTVNAKLVALDRTWSAKPQLARARPLRRPLEAPAAAINIRGPGRAWPLHRAPRLICRQLSVAAERGRILNTSRVRQSGRCQVRQRSRRTLLTRRREPPKPPLRRCARHAWLTSPTVLAAILGRAMRPAGARCPRIPSQRDSLTSWYPLDTGDDLVKSRTSVPFRDPRSTGCSRARRHNFRTCRNPYRAGSLLLQVQKRSHRAGLLRFARCER